MVSRKGARLACERDVAVREQELGLADAARVEDQLSWARVTRCVFCPDADIEVAHRDPPAFTRPTHVDDLRLEREHATERRDRLRCRVLLKTGAERELACSDLQHDVTLAP